MESQPATENDSCVVPNTRKPSFIPSPPPTTQPKLSCKVMRLAGPIFPSSGLNDHTCLHKIIGIDNKLKISSSFGSLFVQDITLEIQTSTNRIPLAAPYQSGNFVFGAGETKDYLVQHEISELGIHCLVCLVSWTNEQNESKSFQKFFKFQVLKPLGIETSINHVEELLFAEARVTNFIPREIFLESVTFLASANFTATDCTAYPSSSDSVTCEKSTGVFLKHQETYTFVFQISMKQLVTTHFQNAFSLGEFEIIWRSSMTEVGRLVTQSLTRRPRSRDIDLTLISAQSEVCLESPFTVHFEVRNSTSQRLELRLQLRKEKMGPILPHGSSRSSLGVFESGERRKGSVTLIPLAPGVHRLSGFRLFCTQPWIRIDFDSLHDVIVLKKGLDIIQP